MVTTEQTKNSQPLGLHDCHVHMVLDGEDFRKALARHADTVDEGYVRTVLARYADAGTVYLREGGDKQGAGWLASRLAGEYGIEYASPVFPICQKGNYGSFIGRPFETMAEYKSLVDEVEHRGGDYIKVMISGIMDFDEFGKLTGHSLPRDMVAEMIGYAHEKGLAVMAHVNGARAIQDAVESGVDTVEHGYYSDAESRRALASSNTIWVPTMAPIYNLIGTGRFPDKVLTRIWKSQVAAIADVAAMGGMMGCGSDAGAAEVRHLDGARDELRLMSDALGDDAERILGHGLAEIRKRFAHRG